MNIKHENHGDPTHHNFLCVYFQKNLSTEAQMTNMFLIISDPHIQIRMYRSEMKTQLRCNG
jgi:hypothetical protein